jgi:signal transduction histidine kinase
VTRARPPGPSFDRWTAAGIAVVGAQLAVAPWAGRFIDTISAGMAVLATLCAARTIALTPARGVPDRWRWQAGSLAWALWAAQWLTNTVQHAVLDDGQLLVKLLSEARLAVLVIALVPLASRGDDRRLRWLDASFALAFALLVTFLAWPDLLDPEPGGPEKAFLYLGYGAMASFAGLSVLGQPAGPLRRMSWALFVTLTAYAVVGISTRELIERGLVGMDAPLFAYGDLPFLAYLHLIGRPRSAPAAEQSGTPGARLVLASRLVPLALTMLIVGLAFVLAYTTRGAAPAAGLLALAIMVAYAARTALVELLHHQAARAALVREQARAAGLTDLMHELRSPLGAIALNASILRRTGAHDAGRAAAAIDSGCEAISRLLDDVLDLERLEAGLVPVKLEPHDVAAVSREVVALLAEEAAEYGVALVAPAQAVRALADAAALRRILLNLIGNALRFTPRGGRVEVTAARHDAVVEVAVADSGIGVPAEVRATLFRRFTIAGRPLNGRRGSGLGLAISHALAGSIGATLTVDPPGETGTTFRVRLSAAAD